MSAFNASRLLFVVVALAVVGLVLNLAATIHGVKIATGDDAMVLRGIEEPVVAEANRLADFRIGRFYANPKWTALEIVLAMESETGRTLVRVGACLLALLAASCFASRATADARVGAFALLLGLGFLPVSLGYQPLLSHPLLWIGWAAVWTAGVVALGEDTALRRAIMAALLAVAFVVHESNLVFIAWPVLIHAWSQRQRDVRRLLRYVAPSAVVLIFYVACFWWSRSAAPSGYSGVQPRLEVPAVLFADFVYSVAGLPGIESWLVRSPDAGAPLLVSADAWWGAIASRAAGWQLPAVGLMGVGLWFMLQRRASARHDAPLHTGALAVVLIFAVLAPNLVLATTVKYQGWAHQRMWPYYYSSMSFLAWILLGAITVRAGLNAIPSRAARAVATALVVILLMVTALAVQGANHEAAGLLRAHRFDHMHDYRLHFRELPSRQARE